MKKNSFVISSGHDTAGSKWSYHSRWLTLGYRLGSGNRDRVYRLDYSGVPRLSAITFGKATAGYVIEAFLVDDLDEYVSDAMIALT